MRWLALLLCACAPALPQARTILAIGAHAGDMEVTSAAVLVEQRRAGDRVVLLHLTLGERGNPKLPPAAYGAQKRAEALAAAKAIGAEVLFGPYQDGELPDDEAARRYVAGVIRQVKPTHVLTHSPRSIHRDHVAAHAIVADAILLAALEGVEAGSQPPRESAPYRGVRAVWLTENWEDSEGYKPYLYVDVSDALDAWKECVTKYEFIRGGVSSFPYLDYYQALARVRGAEAGRRYAVSFDAAETAKRRVVALLP